MAPIPELIGESPSCELSSTVSAEYIEMKVVRKVEDYPVMVVRVRTPEGNSSYYGTNMSKDLVPAKALYLLYRCRWEGSVHTFKALLRIPNLIQLFSTKTAFHYLNFKLHSSI